MEAINKTFDCVMVGGPQHGLRVRMTCSGDAAQYPTLMAGDGLVCKPVGFRRAADGRQLWLLIHPQASGAELREQVAVSEEIEESGKSERVPMRLRLAATC